MKLSRDQVEQYQRDGYTVARSVLGHEDIARILERATAIAHGDHPPEANSSIMRDIHFAKGVLPVPEDPERALWKIMNGDRFDPALRDAMRSPALLDAVSSLIGDDLLAFLFMIIYKPPGVPDSVHPFHQDGLYFAFEPHDQVVGAWLALDRADEENGTLRVVPGTHRLPIAEHERLPGVNAGALGARGVEGSAEMLARSVLLTLDPGDCALFHPHLYHRTGGNRSERHRRVMTMHIASARCRSLAAAQPDVYSFALVRGTTYPGCLQPAAQPSIGFRRSARKP
jgi:phytanoyl-CoA hydroxylase